MNKLLLIVGAIFLISMMIGYVRGFIKIVASLAATIATIILVTIMTPYISEVILKVFPIESMVQEKAVEILMGDSVEDDAEGEEIEITIPEEIENSREAQISLIENAEIPELFRNLLLENNNAEIYEALGVTTFSEYIGSYLAKLIANIASYLIAFLVITIVVRIVLYILGIIGDLPVIGGVNRLAGAVLGLGTGLIIVWVAFIVITLMYDNEVGKMFMEDIAASEFLTNLYNKNILMNYITKFRG